MIQTSGAADIDRFRCAVVRCLGLSFEDAKLGFLADILRRRLDALGQSTDVYLGRLETEHLPMNSARSRRSRRFRKPIFSATTISIVPSQISPCRIASLLSPPPGACESCRLAAPPEKKPTPSPYSSAKRLIRPGTCRFSAWT